MDDAPGLTPKVATDRYRKKLREEDHDRGDSNYARSALAGALAGALLKSNRLTKGKRAGIGAGAGLLAEGAIRVAGAGTKDAFGERSRVAKKTEKIPYYGGLATAAVLGLRRLKSHHFSVLVSPRLKSKLLIGGSLAGGIAVADAATSGLLPHLTPGEKIDRRASAIEGLKRGALYGGVLAAAEPLIHGRLVSALRKAKRMQLSRRIEFRSLLAPETQGRFRPRLTPEEDLSAQRRKLAVLGGGAVAGAGALALMMRTKRPPAVAAPLLLRGPTPTRPPKMPVGRGTLERTAKANTIRADRGYIHLKPMDPRQRKRFDKLDPKVQANAGKLQKWATNPAFTSGERKGLRQAMGVFRKKYNFARKFEFARADRLMLHVTRASRSRSWRKLIAADPDPAMAIVHGALAKGRRVAVDRYSSDSIALAEALRRDRELGKVLRPRVGFSTLVKSIELSAFVKDVAFRDLPATVQKDIGAFVKAKPGTLFSHYGMVAKELLHKADPHNLKAARANVAKLSRKAARSEVYDRRATKHILVNNDRIVDGHHFLAKAERGGVTGSLHVIDLSPSRFQFGRRIEFMSAACGSMPIGVALRKHLNRKRHLADPRRLILFRRERGQLRDEEGNQYSKPIWAAMTGQRVYSRTGPNPGDRVNYGGSAGAIPIAHAQVLRAAYNKASGVQKWGKRGLSLTSDVGDVIAGRPRKVDYAGRPQKREWEKSYAKRIATSTVISGGILGGVVAARKHPEQANKYIYEPLRKAARKINKHFPDTFPGHLEARLPRQFFFDEEKHPWRRRAALAGGLATAAVGASLLPAAASIVRIPARNAVRGAKRTLSNSPGLRKIIRSPVDDPHMGGRMVADYLDAAQAALNRGVHGKVAGRVLEHARANPKGKIARVIAGKENPDYAISHYQRFRAGHLQGLGHWDQEVSDLYTHRGTTRFNPRTGRTMKAMSPERVKQLRDELHYGRTKAHDAIREQMHVHGKNESEALRHVATTSDDPQVRGYFDELAKTKAKAVTKYSRYASLAPTALIGGTVASQVNKKRKEFTSAIRLIEFIASAEKKPRNVDSNRIYRDIGVAGLGLAVGHSIGGLGRGGLRQDAAHWKRRATRAEQDVAHAQRAARQAEREAREARRARGYDTPPPKPPPSGGPRYRTGADGFNDFFNDFFRRHGGSPPPRPSGSSYTPPPRPRPTHEDPKMTAWNAAARMAKESPHEGERNAAKDAANKLRKRHGLNVSELSRVLSRSVMFDAWAEQQGWDLRDPRGRSARVFAPGSRRRELREKEWHETTDGQRVIRNILIGGALGVGVGGGYLLKGLRNRKVASAAREATIKGGIRMMPSPSA